MENNMQEPYFDSPPVSRASSPAPPGPVSPAKPLPPLPNQAQLPSHLPYRDDPTAEPSDAHVPLSRLHRLHASSHASSIHVEFFRRYTDAEIENDDVPLAHLYSYPIEAPPSYAAAVVQSYRDTLIPHISPNFDGNATDEEAGVELAYADEFRFSIERVIAMIIVALVLALISLILVWQILAIKGLL